MMPSDFDMAVVTKHRQQSDWDKARMRHHLARRGAIPWQIDLRVPNPTIQPPSDQVASALKTDHKAGAKCVGIAENRREAREQLTVEKAEEWLRARMNFELQTLNQQLAPRSILERKDIKRLVKILLFAFRQIHDQKNSPLLDRIVWAAGGAFVRTTRRESRRQKAIDATTVRLREARDERRYPMGRRG